ncbi:hypothetical protein NP493_692g02008 [Ridgeia piscesae]|uniref:Cilia- and flagella-associated protein 300 n=1 Tax=Ridgeia piscesae TaxID=27915 RepID=A0AAD9KR17_RIDPI|nr:hypothetical protein NP493_692g02008 [Ridgeia piscesae]
MDTASKFSFQYLSGKKFNSIEGKDAKESLVKWSMKGRLKAQAFSFDQPFKSYQKEDFVTAFFQDDAVVYNLQVVSSTGNLVPLGLKAAKVSVEELSCSVLSMTFFDRLFDAGIVREQGQISKCFDEYIGDFTISDELRKMLLSDESDHFDLYSDTEKQEFLFLLFRHMCLGGATCQYEDNVKPYLDITKLIYKDLVSVQKDPKSGDLHVASHVFRVHAQTEDGDEYYPDTLEHEQNFAYLIIDPLRRHVNVLYHKFGTSSFDDL